MTTERSEGKIRWEVSWTIPTASQKLIVNNRSMYMCVCKLYLPVSKFSALQNCTCNK